MSSLAIKIGADPETVIRNKKTGEYVSAHNLIKGDKLNPWKVPLGAVQVDGVAAEFNIDPAENSKQFSGNINAVLGSLRGMAGDDFELVYEPSVLFPEDYFKSLPESVRELGCNPDYNAWTGQVNEKPDGDKTTMRTFAGHVHIGWSENEDVTDGTHFEDCRIIARNLDYYLGLYSLMWDQDTKRRSLYGKAGAFRPKPYGVEYRPLSNVWLSTPVLQEWVFNAAYKGTYDLITTGKRLEDTFGETARHFIDNSESWWTPEDAKKGKEHRKIQTQLSVLTGLKAPPPIPKKTPQKTEIEIQDGVAKVVTKPNPKHVYAGATATVKDVTGTKTWTIEDSHQVLTAYQESTKSSMLFKKLGG